MVGRMTLPMAVGTVGGVVNVHPTVKINRRLCDLASTAELAAVVTAAGLAQNLSALRALSAEGIQSGHMRLHARNIAHGDLKPANVMIDTNGRVVLVDFDRARNASPDAIDDDRRALDALRSWLLERSEVVAAR